jgi:hypothetical protein
LRWKSRSTTAKCVSASRENSFAWVARRAGRRWPRIANGRPHALPASHAERPCRVHARPAEHSWLSGFRKCSPVFRGRDPSERRRDAGTCSSIVTLLPHGPPRVRLPLQNRSQRDESTARPLGALRSRRRRSSIGSLQRIEWLRTSARPTIVLRSARPLFRGW